MYSKLKSAITGDLKIISSNYRPFIPVTILLLVIFLLSPFLPVHSHSSYLKYGVQPDKYFSLISITLVSMVPMLCGLAYGSSLSLKGKPVKTADSQKSPGGIKSSVYIRIFTLLLISFILIIISILIIKPVPAQGWLRTLYAAILLSFQAPAGFLYTGIKDLKRITGITLSVLYWLFIIALPVGLLLHHPWNHIVFFSPFYWTAWAWIIPSPVESLVCGTIAVILSAVMIIILFRARIKSSSD
jgi:hypothetical protein